MKWVNSFRWLLEGYLLLFPLILMLDSFYQPGASHVFELNKTARQIILLLLIIIIILRIGILMGKIVLYWVKADAFQKFNKKSRKIALIATIGYAIWLIPELIASLQWYHYTNLYFGRVIIFPLPVILGFIDLFMFKSIEK